jgi:PAS domain S-box-containing protein
VKPLRRVRLGIIALSAGLALAYGANAARHMLAEREAAVRDSLERAELLVVSLDEHLARTVQAAGLIFNSAAEQIQQILRLPPADLRQIEAVLDDLAAVAPQLANLGYVDESGHVRADTFPRGVGLDVSDREYFRHHARHASKETLLSEAIAVRPSGIVRAPLSRRLSHPDGRFAGIVYGGLASEYLESFYSHLQGRIPVTLSVHSTQGLLLARIPRRAGATGNLQDDPVFSQLLPRAVAGTARLTADAFGPDRYVAYRRAADMPYVIVASITESLMLQAWRQMAWNSALQAAGIIAAIAGLTSFLVVLTYRRERSERELSESEMRFRDFADAASDWYWEMGPDLRFTRLFGRSFAGGQLIGRRREDLFDPYEPPAGLAAHLEDLAQRRPFRDFRYHSVLPNGVSRYCTTSGKPIFAEDGTFLGYRGTGRDITAEVLTERRAEQARALLSNALEEIAEGFVLYDANDRLVLWNTRYERIHEHTADLMVAGRGFEQIIRGAAERGSIPAARGRLEEWIAERLAAHRQPRSAHEQEFADGRWIRIQETLLSDGGRVGIHTDITEDKRREAELRDLARKNEFFAAAIATTTSGIIITDNTRAERPIVYVNPAFTVLTGYTFDEVVGKSTPFLRDPKSDPAAIEAIEAAWREERAGAARILNRRKDGTTFYSDIRISPLRDIAGRVTHFIGVQNDVTAQVAAEEKLRRSEAHIRSVAENIPGVAMQRVQRPDGSSYYTYLSERTIELSGYTAKEFFDDPGLIWRLVVPEDAPGYKAALARSAIDLKPADIEYRLVHRDGSLRWLRGMFRPHREADGSIVWDCLVFDVTDRVRAEETIREHSARLRSIAENLPGVVYQRLMRADGTVSYPYISARVLELTGYTADEIMADPALLPAVIAPEFHAGYGEMIKRSAREMAPAQFEFRLIRRGGESRWAHGLCRPRPLPNGEIMWDGLIFDVTDQKRVEEQRNQLENQLRHAQRIEALGTFAGGIAHDINNTLVPIVALGRMTLNSMPANSEHRDSLKTILDAAYRVRDLVAEILAFSRKEMPKTERVSLSETITKAVRLISAMVAPNVNIVQRIDSSCVIDADANQLVQVLMNLCTNAAHAIGRNNGQITIGLDEVVIADTAGSDGTSLPPGAYARLTVADNGSGMDAVTRQRIFEPFFTTKTVGEGTGLGLSVAHGIIANHRGRIAVDSELGRGTTFTIHLPLAGSDEIDTPAPPLKRAS